MNFWLMRQFTLYWITQKHLKKYSNTKPTKKKRTRTPQKVRGGSQLNTLLGIKENFLYQEEIARYINISNNNNNKTETNRSIVQKKKVFFLPLQFYAIQRRRLLTSEKSCRTLPAVVVVVIICCCSYLFLLRVNPLFFSLFSLPSSVQCVVFFSDIYIYIRIPLARRWC